MANNTQEMDDSAIMGEDDRQAQKIYHTQNCYMDSLNDRNFQMLNCGNENYRRTTVIDHAKTTNKDELPHPQPCEASTGPTPDSHPISNKLFASNTNAPQFSPHLLTKC